MWPSPVTLESSHATLVPLDHGQTTELAAAVADGALDQLWYTFVPEPQGMRAEIDRRLNLQRAGAMLPFTVLKDGVAVGMTTYMNVDAANRRLEIGSTWYAKSVQRTPLNTSCKLMLLTHAFEALGCIAVEFRTHFMNVQSRRAIERLGAKLDGVLRNHMIMANGTFRDTACYSIIAGEWPTVKANLTHRLALPSV